MIRIYNTLSKTKEEFCPVQPGKVGIYLCGPTVYKPSHIGHMVGPVIFDAVKRYLTYSGYDVQFIINITDVDDKLIAESRNRNVPMAMVAEEMTADYLRNLDAMGVKESVSAFPKVSDHIGNIINFTQHLIDKGFAYESDGDVYYDVGKFSEYGKLSHRSLDQMTGEGGSTASRKHTPFDFALWKSAKPNEPAWDSPWGKGRPGWHIECSVMSSELLGETFDIHGGGLDLVFPHHENEVAQSEARHGKPMCNYWMHNGLMQASSEVGKLGGKKTHAAEEADDVKNLESQEAGKISKSKGSSAFSEMLKQIEPETIRFFLLSTHYRRPIDFSLERIDEVAKGLETFYRFIKRYEKLTGKSFYKLDVPKTRSAPSGEGEKNNVPSPLGGRARVGAIPLTSSAPTPTLPPGGEGTYRTLLEQRQKFLDFMDDDFNTGGAIGVLFDLLRTLNKSADEMETGKTSDAGNLTFGAVTLRELGLTLGLFRQPPKETTTNDAQSDLVDKLMQLLMELRASARRNKDFATADKIRKDLTAMGIVLEDRPSGTEWSFT